MAASVLLNCGLRPCSRSMAAQKDKGLVFQAPAALVGPGSLRLRSIPSLPGGKGPSFYKGGLAFLPGAMHRGAANVAAPLRPPLVSEDSDYGEKGGEDFDTSAPPSFTLGDIRAAIPKHCWVKNTWKSMSYVLRDVVVVFGLAAGAAYFNNWLVWPLYWVAQGTMFWALFVLGHDCGHGSFSNNHKLNSVIGHLTHSCILVPYHGWRISHRTHHQNHGHVEKDESWHPMSEKLYNSLDETTRKLRFTIPWPMLAYPFYLWGRSPGKKGSHFSPGSDLFVPSEKKDVITSTVCWAAMVTFLVGLTFVMGPEWMLKLYVVPYLVITIHSRSLPCEVLFPCIFGAVLTISGCMWDGGQIFVMWLDFVTYLHHHGYEEKVPWYRGKEWSYLRGGLSTIDRDYGWINNIHHDIGTHVVHHLFPQIPHYHLVEATEAVKPIFGKYYREPAKSGPLPFHLLEILVKSMAQDHYVADEGDIVFYQKDPHMQDDSGNYTR